MASSTSIGASPTPTSSFSSSSSASFIGSRPSTVLFFVALCIGIAIASLFVFFTFRYLVRSRYGMCIPAPGYTNNSPFDFGPLHNIGPPNIYYMGDGGNYRMGRMDGRAHAARRRRKMSKDEVEEKFPAMSYSSWVSEDVPGGSSNASTRSNDVSTPSKAISASKDPSTPGKDASAQGKDVSTPSKNLHDDDSIILPPHSPSSEASEASHEAKHLHFSSGDCTICLESFVPSDSVRGLSCGHVFHVECIDPWLTNRRACCPTCKHEFVDQNGEDSTDPDHRDLDSIFSIENADVATVAYRRPTEFKAQTLLCAMSLAAAGRYHTDGPVDLGEESADEDEAGGEDSAGGEDRAGSDARAGNDDRAGNDARADGNYPDYIPRPQPALLAHGLRGVTTSDTHPSRVAPISDEIFFQQMESVSFDAPPVPNIDHINVRMRAILERHPFNTEDLASIDRLAFKSTNRMFRWYSRPFWRAVGIRRLDLYYYFVVWFYERKRERRIFAQRTAGAGAGAGADTPGAGTPNAGAHNATTNGSTSLPSRVRHWLSLHLRSPRDRVSAETLEMV